MKWIDTVKLGENDEIDFIKSMQLFAIIERNSFSFSIFDKSANS